MICNSDLYWYLSILCSNIYLETAIKNAGITLALVKMQPRAGSTGTHALPRLCNFRAAVAPI